MAFQLKTEQPVADGLRRLAKKELRSAREELARVRPPRDQAIHEARKSVKKVRAIVDLVEADYGGDLTRSRKRLRKISRALSRLRDADAMLEILATLKEQHPDLFTEHGYARARRRLRSQKQTLTIRARTDGTWKRVDRQLRKLRKASRHWQPAHQRFNALAAGIRATYGRGRAAMARARKNQRAADFHDWRKQMKALWYQLRLIEASAAVLRRDAGKLHRAETCLGDEHNVVVLCAELSKDESLCDLVRLRHAANQHQCALRQQALRTATRVYGRAPGEFVRHLKRSWKAWQRSEADRARKSRRAA